MSTIPDLSGEWVKSSFSGNGGGNCLEWMPSAVAPSGLVPVRDSKSPEGPTLIVSASQWSRFVDFAKGPTV
jgi:hypothetical protein